ncbi:MAG: bifunctional DNA-formamidopyrimidine glycosylase/DNA-(apurinic or apyrimidinic site) lyase [Chloroflexi bacterium]|nr:bifunctional DNA-formamidopyrimidine glycosylase/DNA-(apurinic or apyrimidinic site) lyase [Chloroflexota bacterium]
MPELPEVETIARALAQGGREGVPIVGHTLHSAEVLWARSLAEPALAEFQRRLPGQQVTAVGRRGKFLQIRLTQDTLLIHLRMSGDLRVEPAQGADGRPLAALPHDRALFNFADNLRLAFNDTRKFGRIWLLADPQKILAELGPEPLDPDFTPEDLYQLLQQRQRQLKPLLLDQAFMAGLGNIYTDEALHLAGLHPTRLSRSLSQAESARLWAAIRQVLEEGIRRNGASIDWVYRGGSFQNTFRVYQRTGQPCPVCGHPIERLLIGQRGTHICPVCQPPGGQAVSPPAENS